MSNTSDIRVVLRLNNGRREKVISFLSVFFRTLTAEAKLVRNGLSETLGQIQLRAF